MRDSSRQPSSAAVEQSFEACLELCICSANRIAASLKLVRLKADSHSAHRGLGSFGERKQDGKEFNPQTRDARPKRQSFDQEEITL